MSRITLKFTAFLWLMISGGLVHAGKPLQDDPSRPRLTKPTTALHCGTENAMRQLYLRQPALEQAAKAEFNRVDGVLKSRGVRTKGMQANSTALEALVANPTYVIPVVFHVYGTTFNGKTVNDAVIIDALRRTNEDFQGITADYNQVIPEFSAIKRTLNIEFRLAKKNPQGAATTGIIYHPAASGFGNGSGYDAQIQADAWDNYKYMNVYIQNDLYADGVTNNSGVAWYPDTWMSNNNLARVVYNGAYLGNNTSENFRSVLTHEFGHYLNLIHTFQGGCSQANFSKCATTGDLICDTPQVNNSSLGTALNCLSEVTNWQNFMNYSDQYANFTFEQVSRMINALNVAARNTLWTAANLEATGTSGGTGNQAPTANFVSAVSGLTVAFTDLSSDSDGTIASRLWNFGDGTTSTAMSPSKAYATAGTYSVSLTVTDNQGATHSVTKSITVSTDTGSVLQNGVAKTGLGAAQGTTLNYTMSVPAGASNLKFTIVGGSGDADLYVRFAAAPTTSTYDCRPYLSGNTETCNIASAQAGTYYVMLRAYAAFSGVSLTGSYSTGGSNQIPVANFSNTVNGLTVNFSDTSTDSDGTIASRVWNFGDGSTSTVTNPTKTYASAGTYSVALTVTDNQGASNTMTKSVTVSSAPTINECTATDTRALGQNCKRSNRSGSAGNYNYLFINMPAGVAQLKVTTSGGTGNANLYVSTNGWATQTNYQYVSSNAGNDESVTIQSPPSGYIYISLYGVTAFSGVTVTTEY